MTGPEHQRPERAPTKEQLQTLMNEMASWIERIISDKPDPRDPMTGHAHISDDEKGVESSITVGDLVSGYIIEHREQHIDDTTKDTITEYSLEYDRNGDFLLTTSGEHPDITEALLSQDVDDETFAKAIQASQELQADNERYATPEEIIELHTILELAAFGDEQFDFDTFTWQLEDAIEDREAMRADLARLEEHNKNNPE